MPLHNPTWYVVVVRVIISSVDHGDNQQCSSSVAGRSSNLILSAAICTLSKIPVSHKIHLHVIMLTRYWLLKPTAVIFSPITRLTLSWLMILLFLITIAEFFYGHSTRSGRIMKPMTQRRSFMPRTSRSPPKNLILASNEGGDG